MAKFCGNCGAPLLPTTIFCGGCGTRVPAPAPAPAGIAAPYTPVSPVPAATVYTPVQPAYEPSPAIPAAAPAGFAPVASTFAATPVAPAKSWTDAPAPAIPVAEPAGFAPIASTFDATPVTPVAEPWADSPVPASPIPPVFTPAAAPESFSPVAPAFTPELGRPTMERTGFNAANAVFTPVGTAPANAPVAYAPVTPVNPVTPVTPATPMAGGAPVQTGFAPAQPAYAPPVATFAPAGAPSAMAPAAYPAKKSNTLLKIVAIFVLLIFVGGALALAGLWYAAQQIKAKARSVTSQVLSGNPPTASGGLSGLLSGASATGGSDSKENAGGFKGDPCRFLTTEEVGQAAGLPVIRAEASEGDCSYIARGDPADVTAKHMSALVGGMGADAKSQQMAQKIAGAFFAQQEAGDKDLSAQAATGEVTVLVLSFTAGHAEMEMKVNRGAFQRIGGGSGGTTAANSASGDLTGIGDEAFVVGGSAIILRKGNTMARIMYTGCPCGTKDVTPLAQKLASRL